MKNLIRLLVVWCLLATTTAQALCFIIHVKRGTGTTYCPSREVGPQDADALHDLLSNGDEFSCRVNGQTLAVEADDTVDTSTGTSLAFKACFEEQDVILDGDNQFEFFSHYTLPEHAADHQRIQSGWIDIKVELMSGGPREGYHNRERLALLCEWRMDAATGFDGAINATCQKNLTFSLRELDPTAWRRLQDALEDISRMLNAQPELEVEWQDALEAAESTLDTIADKPFDALSETDLSAVDSALSRYRDLNTALTTLRQAVVQLREQVDTRLAALNDLVETSLHAVGVEPADYQTRHPFALPTITIPQLIQDYAFEDSQNFYQVYADEVLLQLQSFEAQGLHTEFLETVQAWLVTMERMRDHLDAYSYVAKKEWEAFFTHFTRVETYVFGSSTQPGQLSRDLWFTDSPLTAAQRESVAVIANHFPAMGAEIADALRQWRAAFTPGQAAIAETIGALGQGIQGLADEGEPVSHARDLVMGALVVLKEAGACLSLSVAAGDFGDLYELINGKSLCTGDALTVGERAFSALGLVAGSGAFWRGVGKWIGLLKESQLALQVTQHLEDVGRSLGLSRDRLQALAQNVKNALPCQALLLARDKGVLLSANCFPPEFTAKFAELLGSAQATAAKYHITDVERITALVYMKLPDGLDELGDILARMSPRYPSAGLVETFPDGSRRYRKTIDGIGDVDITYSRHGFPDFSGYMKTDLQPGQVNTVNIEYQGDYYNDFRIASEKAGFFNAKGSPCIPIGFTWHHDVPIGVMRLVDKRVHQTEGGFSHRGGTALFRAITGGTYPGGSITGCES
ncbi:MAG: HNH endonuclease [Pseudomonadota bacterium]